MVVKFQGLNMYKPHSVAIAMLKFMAYLVSTL